MLSKIDNSILDKISIQTNNKENIDIIVKANNYHKTYDFLQKSFNKNNILQLPIVSSFALKTSVSNIFKIAKFNSVEYISNNTKVCGLIYDSKKLIGTDYLRSKINKNYNHSCVIIDTGVYPHIDFLLGKNRIVKFVDLINDKEYVYDDNGHGTFVTGVLCGNSIVSKYSGVDNNCNIIVIKALDNVGETNSVKILQAMQWILDNKNKYNIKVVCMSFGSVPSNTNDPLINGAEVLWNNGIVVVSAGGNSGPEKSTIMSPGASKKIITVGSLDRWENSGDLKVADFSSRGPINNLYKLFCLVYNKGNLSMDFFEKKSTEEGFLHDLQILQRTMENWYNDSHLYHLILFTSLHASEPNKEKNLTKLSFSDFYQKWKEYHRKDFIRWMKDRIARCETFDDLLGQFDISLEDNEHKAKEENWFDNKLVSVSTLLDIISILSTNSNGRLTAKYFKAHKEDLEHIFPQTPIGDKIKDKDKQTQILKQYLSIINKLSKEEKIIIEDNDIDWDNIEWRNGIKDQINNLITELIPINSLGNMCVLHESVNRGYGNDFFLEKRIDIMRKSQKGYFIRPHVYDAFNKIFVERQDDTIDMTMMTKWDKDDILERRKYIITEIHKFLSNE